MDDFRLEEEHILFDIAIDKWHKDSIDKSSVIHSCTFPTWFAGNDIRREQMWTFAQKIQPEDIALALQAAKRVTNSQDLLRIVLSVHNPIFRASQISVFIEQWYMDFLMEYISKLDFQNKKHAKEIFEYYALQLGWQGSHAHFAAHLLTEPQDKMPKITYFQDYCHRNYEKYICSQQAEEFVSERKVLDIKRMQYLVAYPFVWEDEQLNPAEMDISKTPRKKRTRKPRVERSQNNNSKSKIQPVLATYHPEHLVTPKEEIKETDEESYFSAKKFVFVIDRAFAMFQDEELAVGWSRLKAQIEAYGQKVYETECEDVDEMNDCAYCDFVTAFDWTYYAYYHRGISDCEEETPCAIIDALYAFFHTQTRSFPYRIAYFHFLFLVGAEFADGNTLVDSIQKANAILNAHYESRIFDCSGYRTIMTKDMNVQFAKNQILSAS